MEIIDIVGPLGFKSILLSLEVVLALGIQLTNKFGCLVNMELIEVIDFTSVCFKIISSPSLFIFELTLSGIDVVVDVLEVGAEFENSIISSFSSGFKTRNNHFVVVNGFIDKSNEIIHNWGANARVTNSFFEWSLVESAESQWLSEVWTIEELSLCWKTFDSPSSPDIWTIGFGVVTFIGSFWPCRIVKFVHVPAFGDWIIVFLRDAFPVCGNTRHSIESSTN